MEVDEMTDKDNMSMVRPPDYYSKGRRCRIVRISKDHPYYRTSNKGNVSEARLVMAEHLGRNLTKDDIVYFKDGNVTNIGISNLVALTKREYHNVQNCRKLEIARARIDSKISVYRQRIIDSGIDPVTLDKDDPEGRWRQLDADREAYDRSRGGRGEAAEYL